MLAGVGTSTGTRTRTGIGTAINTRMVEFRRSMSFLLVVGQEVEHSKLHQSAEAEDKADGDVEIQDCDIGDTWEILARKGAQCGHGEYGGDP